MSDTGTPGDPGRRRSSPEDRRRDLRRRRRNALLIVLAGLVVVVAFVAWAARDNGPSAPAGDAGNAEGTSLQVFAHGPRPQLPAPATRELSVTATGGAGLQMRVVATPRGVAPVAGAWQPAGGRLPIPANVSAVLEAGSLPGHVEVRDDSGHTARSSSLLLPPTPGEGTATVVRSVSTRKPYVALVFDDGLDQQGVRRIIAELRRSRSGGTFCFNGINVKAWPTSLATTVHAAVADGVITLCSHGWGHRTSTTTTEAEAVADLENNATTDRYIGAASVPFYRPPYGALSPGIQKAAGKLGYRYIVLWDVDPSDYQKPDAATLTQRVVSQARPGSIVVLHAIATTADALPSMIKGLRAKGLKAVTLTTMFGSAASGAPDSAASRSDATGTTGGDAPPASDQGA